MMQQDNQTSPTGYGIKDTAKNSIRSRQDKQNESVFAAFAQYDRRFQEAVMRQPLLKPWVPGDRAAIIEHVKHCLRITDHLIPNITITAIKNNPKQFYSIDRIQATSWPGVCCAANLYKPDRPEAHAPFVLLCCGHGASGKLNPGYQAMAARLARQGAMVLVMDNIGQGERVPMGHANPVVPFACNLTLQGLIVMETIGWLRWAMHQLPTDRQRLAAIGNSGGGTLTLFLAAVCPELSVISSSGYPSSFEFIARKEKKHCHCNLLPGIIGRLEMWQVLGTFAPKPLFLFQGNNDHLFPEDLFYRCVRQVRTVYTQYDAVEQLSWASIAGPHPWFLEKRHQLAVFLAENLQLDPAETLDDDLIDLLDDSMTCYTQWPQAALDTDKLARQITDSNPEERSDLWTVFPPRVDLTAAEINGLRGDIRQIFAQYEAFLADW